MPKFYLTTAIPYVNAKPHIGFALECVQADAIARYKSLSGSSISLTTGADENSLKNVQAAEKAGLTTAELCAKNAEIFRELVDRIGLSYTSFIRSSVDKGHRECAATLWESCNKSGDIYKKKYKGLYCVGCELFYTENELVNGLCPEHHTKPELVEEENYFFRLSKYQDRIERLVEKGDINIIPASRKDEVLNFVKEGLDDFSISRSVKRAHGWGIPVPGDETQIMYVWFDALGIYLTGVGFPNDKKKFGENWPADMHVIGKGIIRFHLVYWPAMLMSAGLPLPKSILIHGYVTNEGKKMSKSIGNVVEPIPILDKYGVDPVRYYLLKEISTFQDGDFSEKTLRSVIDSELVGNLGNFANRTLTFIDAKFGGSISGQEPVGDDAALLDDIWKLVDQATEAQERCELNVALLKILEISNAANRYFQNSEPWKLIKEDEDRARQVLYVCANICRILGILMYPYMPGSSERLLRYLNEKPGPFKDAKTLPKSFKVAKPEVLFKKAGTA